MDSLIFALTALSLLLVLCALVLYEKLVVLVAPGQLCIIEGRGDGQGRDYRLVSDKRGLRIPFLETAKTLDTTLMQVEIVAEDVICAEGESVTVTADVFASISRRKPGVYAAVERFLGHSRAEIEAVIDDTVVDCLLETASGYTSGDIHGDRHRFEVAVSKMLFDELEPMGFVVQTFCLQRVVAEGEELPQSPTTSDEATAVANPW